MTEEDKTRGAWEVYLYARDLLAKRMSYGMVAQSMLLIAFSTLATGRAGGGFFIKFFHCAVAILAIIYTSYLYFRIRAIHDKLKFLEQEYFVSKDLVFNAFLRFNPRQKFSREFSQIAIIIIFLMAWIILLLGALLLTPT